jgi:Xaa-Pro aminopeptidase
MWPEPSTTEAFVARRQRLLSRFTRPVVFAAGHERPRNFPHNLYPFRAESHFLYFVGRALAGAVLQFADGRATLYAPAPDPEEALWTGPRPSLSELGEQLGLDVRPVDELSAGPEMATLPPQDLDTAAWLAEVLGRDLEAGGGDSVSGVDRELAELMVELRLVHDQSAIRQLEQAAQITVRAHRAGMAATRPGLREAAVRAQMEAEIIAAGMTTSYNSIVSVHGEVLHNQRHENEISAGDLLLADVGAETPEGWAGDVTRTWPVSGKFSSTQRAIYEVVLASQAAAIAAVGPSVRYLDVHRAAGRQMVEGLVLLGLLRGDPAELYERGAAGLFFPHGVGHLLGLDVHDMEDLGDLAGYAPNRQRPSSRGDRYLRLDRDLSPGMAVTIEPGFYRITQLLDDPREVGDLEDALVRTELARYTDVRGIRIEDDVLVTADGARVLTAALAKTVADVEAAVGRV